MIKISISSSAQCGQACVWKSPATAGPGCIGQLREVTWVNTQGFYTKTLNPPDPKLNAANEGRGAILWWGAARTWEFEDGVCKSYTRSEHTAETLIMAFRVLEKEAV